ncbi:serine hydrolase [Winogradskyella sp. R77965]|uniref:serine hydrolase n=1 Tax=Winogradskyella sp. R77965 TaxID=3093872 RepID=UPI0037DC542E
MKILKILCFTILFALTTFNDSAISRITPADIDQFVLDEMVRQELPGLAIGVYVKGEINYTKGYGHIDLDRTIPMTKSTVFGWASISKTLTAIATLQLAEKRSDFNIEDRVVAHYPYWTSNFNKKLTFSNSNTAKVLSEKKKKESITIKQLLGHRSGINQYKRGVSFKKGTYKTDADSFNANASVDIFRNMDIEESPGSKYIYSTYGYDLLGAVVDKVSGSYTGWVNRHIKNKLGLSSLKISPKTRGFQKKVDGILNEEIDQKGSKEYVLPGGGWKSDIQDLLKFSKGIIDGKLLDDTSQLWANDFNQKYRRGIWSKKEKNDFRIWHGGSQNDVRTMMYIMPDDEISVVVAYPTNYPDRMNLVRRIMDKLGYKKRFFDLKPQDTCGRGMGSSKKHKFIGVWRKTEEDVLVRRGYTSDNFKKEWQFLKTQGYEVVDIESWKRANGATVWDGIFKENQGKNAMYRNYDHSGFKKKWEEMNKKGYRLFDLETYVINGKRKWAGLFKKSSEKSAMWRNLSSKNFEDMRKSMQSKGLQLIDIEVYNSGGKLKWSGVWLKGETERLNSNISFNDFKTLIKTRSNQGYKLIDVETYKLDGERKWSGIWERTDEPQELSDALSFCSLMKQHDDLSKNKYELMDLIRFNK